MRRGFNTQATQAEKMLAEDPFSGHLFLFRGRRGVLLKVIWWDSVRRTLTCEQRVGIEHAWQKTKTNSAEAYHRNTSEIPYK
ncbi:MAG: IS66 family insertion sequence element accessory protein TnpB [Paracoccaceae bacterium]